MYPSLALHTMWHRFLRQIAFWVGFATCAVIVAVIYFNQATVTLSFWRWELTGVNLGLVAVAPLVAGVALGYLYHLPARLHHVSEHMRHRRRVHELERELKDLRKGMDQVLEMPEDSHAFPALEVGFAWNDPDAAIADAKHHIDRFRHRWTTSEPVPSAA